jgi:hypothetical protein
MINQCLKCHDANGAMDPEAQVSGGTPGKPFATTITTSGYYQGGNGMTACGAGTNGCVTNIDASFGTGNASYHPIKGKQNNSYIGNAAMMAPWNALPTNKTAGVINATNSWGYLISCWDCHAASSGTLTSTVTAHGSAPTPANATRVTVRARIYTASTLGSVNLCRQCHFPANQTSNHPASSAAASHDNNPNSWMARACHYCHLSTWGGGTVGTPPPRPMPAQDYHGFDAFGPNMPTTDRMWPVGTLESFKPYAFMRNVGNVTGSQGNWRSANAAWRPRTAPGQTMGAASCGGNVLMSSGCTGRSHNSYGPGGVY